MAILHFRPKFAYRSGTQITFAQAPIAATSSATVNTLIPRPDVEVYVEKATVTLSTLGVAASGTILLKLQAVATDGTTARDLTSTALSLESDGVATALVPVNLTIDATSPNRVIKEGETLRVEIISSNTNGTAPVGFVNVELFVQK
jgi:hypothetical protein